MITEWRFKILEHTPSRIICDNGEIFNSKGKKLKLKKSRKGGYLRARMYKNGEFYTWVHRMVGYAFLGDCTNLEVHHNDRDVTNNHYLNLKILTKQENLDLRVYEKQN